MMRAAGAFTILLAALSLGVCVLLERKRRRSCLRQLCICLDLLEAELGTNAKPLADMFRDLSSQSEGDMLHFFHFLSEGFAYLDRISFFELWKEAVCVYLPQLTSGEREELIHLGCVLGKYELSRQCAALARSAAFFRDELNRQRERGHGEDKLILALPTALGLLLVIFLL